MADMKLDEKKKQTVLEFVETMKGLYGPELVSLSLFGDGVVESPGQAGHPVKILAVLSEVGPSQLKKYAEVHGKWLKKGIHAPLMITLEMMESSTDVFPMEFLEMKEAYTLLYGSDVLVGLTIGTENLRRECEEQVKGKLLHLQQGYIEAGGEKAALGGLIAASIGPFTEVMRNLLRLAGKAVPAGKDAVVRDFCAATGLDDAPFKGALWLRREAPKLSLDELDALFGRYLEQVRALAEKVDKMVDSSIK